MLKETTRQAIAARILFSLRGGQAAKTVKAAQEIFYTSWTDDDIQLLCSYIKEHDTLDWANETWPNGSEQIYKQLYLFTLKATDFQLVLWLEKVLNDGEKALKFLVSCEKI